jgi:pilus assembly protein Flp/PilA
MNVISSQNGQGLVEYALILILVVIIVIVVLALIGPRVGLMFSNVVIKI